MEADPAQLKLVTFTALAFTVEQDNEQVQALRQQFDPAFVRWQPHINFSFPFVDTPYFDQVHQLLQNKLGHIAPFDIRFRQMDCFPHGTVFLNPETDGNQLQAVFAGIREVLPQAGGGKEFHPHMTVGKFSKGEVNKRRAELSAGWKEWRVRCDGLSIIHRGKDTPFQTYKKILFQG